MKVHLPRLGLDASVDGPVATLERLADADRIRAHEICDDPEVCGLILFCQCHMLPTDWRLTTIREHPLTKTYPSRVMVYDERDRPWCAFPGIYVSMPAQYFEPRYQQAWGYFPQADVESQMGPRDLLFSFIGSPSHKCRRRLFELRHPDAVIEEVSGFTFYDPSSPDFELRRQRFRSVMSRSRFVLCPRGKGVSSIRLYEAIAHGCVPVIVSDDWVPPSGPEWGSFSIRWPEAAAEGLIGMLEERDARWDEMGRLARSAYERFFAPEVAFHRMIECCSQLLESGWSGELPAGGIRGRAYAAAAIDVARWRTSSGIRRRGKQALRRFHVMR